MVEAKALAKGRRDLRLALATLSREELIDLVVMLFERVEGIVTREDLMAMIRRVMR